MTNTKRQHHLALCLLLAIALALSLAPSLATAEELPAADALTIAVAYDKEAYDAGDTVTATIVGTNASGQPLSNVSLAATVPDGCEATSEMATSSPALAANEALTLQISFVAKELPTNAGNTVKAIFAIAGIVVVVEVALALHRMRVKTACVLVATTLALAGSLAATARDAQALIERETLSAQTTSATTYAGTNIAFTATMEATKPAPTLATIHVMHINDTHGWYKSNEQAQSIGFAALRNLKDALGADLLVDAGNALSGQSFATIAAGDSVARLMDAAGVDATTPGVHDWTYGDARLQELDRSHAFSILAANATTADGAPFFEHDHLVKDIVSDEGVRVRVGIVGAMDEALYGTIAPAYVQNVAPPASAAERVSQLAASLRAGDGCDVVIALTSSDAPEDWVTQTSGLDAVVAGHAGEDLERTGTSEDGPTTDKDGRNVAVVEVADAFTEVGMLDLVLTNPNGDDVWDGIDSNATTYDYEDTADQRAAHNDVSTLVQAIEEEEAATLIQAIGTSSAAYDHPFRNVAVSDFDDLALSFEWLHMRDEPIGHVVGAAYLSKTGADLALEDANQIRGGIPVGEIKNQDVLNVSPLGTNLQVRELKGSQIRQLVEQSLTRMIRYNNVYTNQLAFAKREYTSKHASDDHYTIEDSLLAARRSNSWPSDLKSVLVVGGARLAVNWRASEGNRITAFTLPGNKALANDETYAVAMSDAVSANYEVLEDAPLLFEWGTCESAIRDFVAQDGWEAKMAELTGNIGEAISPPYSS